MNVLNTNFLVDSYVQNSKESLMLLPFTVIQRGVLSFTKKYVSAFILDGFQNWKKVLNNMRRVNVITKLY